MHEQRREEGILFSNLLQEDLTIELNNTIKMIFKNVESLVI